MNLNTPLQAGEQPHSARTGESDSHKGSVIEETLKLIHGDSVTDNKVEAAIDDLAELMLDRK